MINCFLSVRPDHYSTSQIETITSLQEIVRLAIVQLAIRDGDATKPPANYFKLITVHHGGGTCLDAYAQHTRVGGHYLGEIGFSVRALANVDVDRRIRQEAKAHAVLFRDVILKVFVLNPAAD
jgi:hypothetical protein